MTNLVDLDIFARVVTAGSMSAAGRELGLSPAVISKRIRRLEERLGTRLLHRTTRQIALTEAGQGFYERVVGILASVEEAEAWVTRRSSAVRGVLRVSAPTSFGRLHVAPHLPGSWTRIPSSRSTSCSPTRSSTSWARASTSRCGSRTCRIPASWRAGLRRITACSARAVLPRGAWRAAAAADLARHRLLAHNADQWRLEGPDGPVTVHVESPLQDQLERGGARSR